MFFLPQFKKCNAVKQSVNDKVFLFACTMSLAQFKEYLYGGNLLFVLVQGLEAKMELDVKRFI